MALTILSRLNLTEPTRWARLREMGRTAFIMRYGVAFVGMPFALLLHAFVLWTRGDGDLLLAPSGMIELTFTLLIIAPLAGAVVGRSLWQRGERKSGHLDREAFAAPATAPVIEPRLDIEQVRLSRLREHLEDLARTAPDKLALRTIGMVVLGYGYVIGFVAALAITIVWMALYSHARAPQIPIFLFMFGFFFLSALFVRVPAPEGKRVTRAGSPRLFDALERIQRALDAPAPDTVIVTSELNAAVTELPRYGIFGLPKRYLVIGLPLFEAMPSDEAQAVLAHEMAHLSRLHVRRLLWVGRLSVSWQVLATSLTVGRHWARAIFLPFFRWYAPRLELHAQLVSRQDEYESDALAGTYSSPQVMARALVRLHVLQRHLASVVIPQIHGQSADRAEPPPDVPERMARLLRGMSREDAGRSLAHELSARTLDDHSHPSLSDRVARLTVAADGDSMTQNLVDQLVNTAGGPSAADELLGASRVVSLRTELAGRWQVEIMDRWRGWHGAARLWQAEEGASDAATDSANASVEFQVMLARARWAVDCAPASQAVELLREVLRREPSHAEASIQLGRLLLDSDDPAERVEGLRTLQTDYLRDTAHALVAAQALEEHYAREGSIVNVERVQSRARQLSDRILFGLNERLTLREDDALLPLPLPATTLERLRRACGSERLLASAYLVRKRPTILVEDPCVVLAAEVRVAWYKLSSDSAPELAVSLSKRVSLPGVSGFTVVPVEPRSGLLRRLREIPGAEVYRR